MFATSRCGGRTTGAEFDDGVLAALRKRSIPPASRCTSVRHLQPVRAERLEATHDSEWFEVSGPVAAVADTRARGGRMWRRRTSVRSLDRQRAPPASCRPAAARPNLHHAGFRWVVDLMLTNFHLPGAR